ncbi:MAG TPA: hypothetical protein VGN07_21335 [Steroidobacteraceae bacterium]|jgi:hypothetical protein
MFDTTSSSLSLGARIEMSIAQVRQLNRWFVELMAVTRSEDCPATPIAQCQSLGDEARMRLSEFPVLLANLRFEDAAFWIACRKDVVTNDAHASFPPTASSDAIAFVRCLLVTAWQMAHDARAPRFLLGMTDSVAAVIDRMMFQQLDWIAVHYAASLRPRWIEIPDFWPKLLQSAQGADPQAWSDFQLHALRLLGRDLLARDPNFEASHRRRAPL